MRSQSTPTRASNGWLRRRSTASRWPANVPFLEKMKMASTVARLKKDLEARGECVKTANAATGWFAVYPATWLKRTERARRDGRKGPNLVVCRTTSEDPRDHYVIPYSVARKLLVDDTLTTSTIDGSRRWNLTLKNGKLHVSHRVGKVDVTKHRGARLLGEGPKVGIPAATDGTLSGSPRLRVAHATPREKALQGQPTAGAGFGRSEENRKIEEAAVNLVCERYRREGWRVESVEELRYGYDLHCVRDGEEAHVEVKGVAGVERRFVITAGELRCAHEDDLYVLALVTSALSSGPVLELLPAVAFRKAFTFVPIQYWAVASEKDGCAAEVRNKGAASERGQSAVWAKPAASRSGRGR